MKSTVISIIAAGVLIGGAFYLSKGEGGNAALPVSNVSIEGGTQIIEIDAKGGYFPRRTVAKADMPTILRLRTSGTFDCSAAFTIPEIGYEKFLPRTGTTDIEIPPKAAGSALRGLCSMGMYSFVVDFE